MSSRTITNPVTGERVTFVETSAETGGARSVGILEVSGGTGGVPAHSHDDHEETIEVLEGEIEVTIEGVRRRHGPGARVVIPKGKVHAWRRASPDRALRFRGTMTPGHPGFELALRVLFGLARDGQVRRNGLPRRFADLALFTEWNAGPPAGPARWLRPLLAWAARRARASGRAAELVRRYDGEEEPKDARLSACAP